MKIFRKLGHNLFTALVVLIISIIGFACSSFLVNTELKHIPYGFLFSGGVIALIYVISHLLNYIDKRNGTTVFTILSMGVRLILTLTTLLLICFMYYKWDIKLFNVFVFVGMYTVGIIVLCLSFIFLKEKEGKE